MGEKWGYSRKGEAKIFDLADGEELPRGWADTPARYGLDCFDEASGLWVSSAGLPPREEPDAVPAAANMPAEPFDHEPVRTDDEGKA